MLAAHRPAVDIRAAAMVERLRGCRRGLFFDGAGMSMDFARAAGSGPIGIGHFAAGFITGRRRAAVRCRSRRCAQPGPARRRLGRVRRQQVGHEVCFLARILARLVTRRECAELMGEMPTRAARK